ncbi:AraC family transcriptional regulator [Hahella sp. CCB-MM4]|nr:AraC family transcriptional regulator [Hahella sp. CCB-MM4]
MNNLTPNLDLRSYHCEMQNHQHDYHQLVLPVQGQLQMTVGHSGGQVYTQQAAFIAAGENHSFAADDNNRFVVADIPHSLAPTLERLPAFLPMDPALVRYVEFMHQQILECQTVVGNEGQSKTTMLLLLTQLLMERHGGTVCIDRRVAAAKTWLDQHYQQPVSLYQLAEVAHLSQRQLVDLFKQSYRQTPHQYLTSLRMQHARQLLEQTDLSVQRIADEVGYSNLSAFSDRFRQHFGKSPRYFRSNSDLA